MSDGLAPEAPRRRGPPPPSGEWTSVPPVDDDLITPIGPRVAPAPDAAPRRPVAARGPAAAPPPASAPPAAPAGAARKPPSQEVALGPQPAPPRPTTTKAKKVLDPFAHDPFAHDPFAHDPFEQAAPAPTAAPAKLVVEPAPAPPAPVATPGPSVEETHREAAEEVARPLLPPPRVLRPADSDDMTTTGGSRTGPPVPPRRRSVVPLVIGVSASALLVVPGIVYLELDRRHAERQRKDFLLAYEDMTPERALEVGEALPDGARADVRVAEVLETLRRRVRRAQARVRAEEVLAGLPAAKTFEERLTLCNRAIVTDDSCADAYVERARLRLRAPNADLEEARRAALVDLSLAVEREPTAPRARYERACLLLLGSEQERQDARRELRTVSEMDALGGLGGMGRARLELLDGQPEAARRSLDVAVERLPNDAAPLLLRADVSLLTGDASGALRDANAAARLDPGSALALALRAEARWAAHEDRVGARSDLEEALKLDPALARGLALRADLRLERDASGEVVAPSGEQELAAREAEEALRADPWLGRAHLVRAELAAARGQLDAAITHATRALEVTPALARAHLLRGRLRARRGEHAAALEDFGQVLRVDPENVEALTRRAGALVRERRYDTARADLDRVLQRREVPEAYLYRGVATLRGNKGVSRYVQAAIEDLTRAIALAPRLADAYFHRAEAHFDREAWDSSLEDLRQAETLGDAGTFRGFDVAYLRGHCHFQRKEYQEALAAYSRYLELAPQGEAGLTLARRRQQMCREKLAGGRGDW